MSYIIKYLIRVDGKLKILYHENITLSTSKECSNVYMEHLTSYKKKALVFYTKEEAVKIADLFMDNRLNYQIVEI